MNTYVVAMHGALAVMGALAGLFFLRYWWSTKDRLFLWFAVAFATFGLNWALVIGSYGTSEHTASIYGVRLVGFLFIGAAIVLKNRSAR